MFSAKIFWASVLLVGASAMHIPISEPFGESQYPAYDVNQDLEYLARSRVRRQAGSVTLNGDGGIGLAGKLPVARNGGNVLSVVGTANLDDKLNLGSKGLGVALDNENGHGLSVIKQTIHGMGSRVTGQGHVAFGSDKHQFGANALVARTMPNIPNIPNFNSVGGGLDYTYNNKVGASLDMVHTPFLDRKDYSAMGNLNLFRDRASSVDFNAGFRKIDSPFLNTGWKPDFGLTFSRSF